MPFLPILTLLWRKFQQKQRIVQDGTAHGVRATLSASSVMCKRRKSQQLVSLFPSWLCDKDKSEDISTENSREKVLIFWMMRSCIILKI